MFASLLDSFAGLVYPQKCLVCGGLVGSRSDGIACTACWENAELFSGWETLCIKCGAFLSRAEPVFETRCGKCGDHDYDRARSIGIYKGAIASCVVHLKRSPFVGQRLADLLASGFDQHFASETTLIVPVPLSEKRQRERGFNQAGVIARVLSRRTVMPVDEYSLVRRFHTPLHRAGMDEKARALSVRNAFEVRRPKLIAGQNVLLVDDVLTSGATASNCAKALKKSGAPLVNVLTLGRAV